MSGAERALARIDLGAIERNARRLGDRAGSAALCAVVKADGYGHGAAPAAEAALRGGATWLAVATAAEARRLREHGIEARLLVMGALTGAELREAVASDADVVVWTRELAAAAAALGGARLHVKLDTGMGRLGTKDVGLARSLLGDGVAGVMTHFATADEPGDELFPEQLERFGEFVEELQGRPSRGSGPRRQQRRHLPRPGRALRHGPLRRGSLWPGSVPGRPRGAWARACAGARVLGRRTQALPAPGTVPATGAAGALPGRPGSPPCRSGTAMAGGAASPTARTC